MPEPITIAIITTVGGIIAAAVPIWLSRKNKKSNETITVEQPKPIERAPAHDADFKLPDRSDATNPMIARTEAELSKIANSITDTPPFSQTHVKEQHLGRTVDWVGSLNSAGARGDTAEAYLSVGSKFSVFCSGPVSNGDVIRTARKDDLIRVTGKICRIITPYVLELSECSYLEA